MNTIKILKRLSNWLFEHKDNKLIMAVVIFFLPILNLLERIVRYFHKDVTVYVNLVHYEDGVKPYTVNGFVERKGKIESFVNIAWEDVAAITQKLKYSNRPMILEVVQNEGWTQEVYLPSWARIKLADELIELQEKYGE